MKNDLFEIPKLYKIIPLMSFRRTPGVEFDILSKPMMPQIDSIDRVIHIKGAISPGSIDDVQRPWYMHHAQDDNLIVLCGTRYVDIYTKEHGKIESFTVTSDKIIQNNRIIYEGGAILVWPRGVFHRITSGENGSSSINLATHHEGFDIQTNFNIYDLDVSTGNFKLLRNGYLDQCK